MSSWIALSRTDHANKHWRPRKGYEFAATKQIVPVIIAELAKLLPHYVTGFAQGDDGSFQFVALVGVGGDRNLYITKDSQWLCSYVPASLRAYPFALLNDSEGNKVFCLDDDYLSDDDTFPRIFKDDSTLDKAAAETLDFISQCEQNRLLTVKACAALSEAGLIQSWPISIDRGEGQDPLKINGLHKVDEEKLGILDADALTVLRDLGGLPLAYAQLFSTAQVDQLTQRADYLAKEKDNVAPSSSLGSLLSNDDEGSLNFDALDPAKDNS